MQAASIDFKPAQPTSIQDRAKESGNAPGRAESGLSPSFSAILGRAIHEVGRAGASGDKGSVRSQDHDDSGKVRRLSNRKNTLETAEAVTRRGKKSDKSEAALSLRGGKAESRNNQAALQTGLDSEGQAAGKMAAGKSMPDSKAKAEKAGLQAKAGEAPRKDREGRAAVALNSAETSLAASSLSGMAPARTPVRSEDPAPADRAVGADDKRANDRRSAKVSVVDLRMRPAAQETSEGRETKPAETAKDSHGTVPVGSRPDGGADVSEKAEAAKPQAGGAFSDILSRHLSNAGSQDIVKAAHIVLRDGDAGLIRLRLEPESLGNVKIELKMTEKNITGRIIVETDEARTAFEKSLSGLRDAFTAGGFETTSLEVSVGGGEAEGRGETADEMDIPFFSGRLRELGDSVPPAAFAGERGERGVNILA